ncbi:MAG: rod shape-determining protein RodA [Candidatus Magasanikbacteria bacterium]|nr:rod shape-determining protein RodA [Candidatus Magasanikbacteria bacterium]
MRSILAAVRSWRQFDWLLLIFVAILASVGLATIYSIDLSRGGSTYLSTQLVAIILGLVLIVAAGSVHVTVYQSLAKFFYVSALALLTAVLFFGQTVRGTKGWFRLAGFSFQPAEFAKVALILLLAYLVGRHGRRFDRPHFFIASGLLTFFIVLLIILQPDLGSAIVLLGVWSAIAAITAQKRWYLLLFLVGFLTVAGLGWFFFLREYQKDRLLAFIHPNDPTCAESICYNVRQSLIAIGAGQVSGRGLGFGSQSQLHFLPEAQTDFIFSVVAEELGLVGVSAVFILYGLIFWRLLRIVRLARDDFGAYTVFGIVAFLSIQSVLNLGAATGLLPVTGLTLPFLSAGGSSFVMNCLLIGIAESVGRSERGTAGTILPAA